MAKIAYLPIGSVVLLKNANKRIMIYLCKYLIILKNPQNSV